MSYKTIVVHLDDGPCCAARIGIAAGIAARFDGRLVGIAATGLPDVILSMNSAVPDRLEFIAATAASLRARAEGTARVFERRGAAEKVAAVEARVVVDEPLDAVVRHGRCSDLVVVGQCDRSAPVVGVAFDLPQQILLHAGPPVLVVPSVAAAAPVGRRILVAWKDTREAARALREALPLLRLADRVVLCHVAEDNDDEGSANGNFGLVTSWLAAHAVPVETRLEPRGEAGERLLSRAAECGADLIVAGGYGHSRLREWVLGGATHHLLAHMTVPVLFAH